MKKNLIKILAFVLTLTMIVSLMVVPASGASSAGNLGKLLDNYAESNGKTYTLNKEKSRIFVVSDSAPTGDLLQTVQLIHSQFAAEGYVAADALVWGPVERAETGDIVLQLKSGIAAEGYEMDVADTAKITASDVDGLLYGTNTLMKCFAYGTTLQGFTAANAPDTKERTVHLDLARKYYTAEWVKNFIRQMSWMGYNALELHLSEDGGFRADFWDETYYTANYRPENDFRWLAGSHVQNWVHGKYVNDPNAGDYLTTEELVEICDVAKEYHIEIIPSFDSPAHMDYITWAFEQKYKADYNYSFKYNGTTYYAKDTSGCINYKGTTGGAAPGSGYTTMELSVSGQKEKRGKMSKAFVFALYEDIADFFKEYAGSTKFMIGADEVNLSSSTWQYSDFVTYVNELNDMLNEKGYKVRMYNDFIGSTTYNQEYDTSEGISDYNSVYAFDGNIEIVYWNSDFDPTSGEYTQPIWHVKFFWENNTGTSDNWGDGGRTLYNGIQTNTYYVLREATSGSHRDARDPDNRNWTFYGTNEEDIYNKWYPADISEKGVYTEKAAAVPDAQLGGAYFMIWNDYAALSTESQVWNGAPDCWTNDRTYYLFDIMASNITKMWNSDINSSVTYSNYATVRNTVSGSANNNRTYFPGYTSCSKAANLPDAAEITKAFAADQSALNNALKNKISNDGDTYTPASYAVYEKAYADAKALLGNADAPQAEVDAAVEALLAAESKLQEKGDKTELKKAIERAEGLTADGYTAESWAKVESALKDAKAVNDNDNATKAEVDAATEALNAAVDALDLDNSEEPEEPEVSFELENLGKTAVKGKKVGLRIVTAADAAEPVVKNSAGAVIETDRWSAEQTIDGETVIVWLVEFDTPDVSGNYTVTVGEEVAALPITVG